MIAVDSSALVAIAFDEPDADALNRIMSRQAVIVGTPVLVETNLVLRSRLSEKADLFLERMLAAGDLVPEPFTFDMYRAARQAFIAYGRGSGHPARLNFGDCLSYAVAKVRGVPLLYKGEDFAETDIRTAL